MKAPIAIIVFNRPDHVGRLLERLQSENSRELFVISDGPREGKRGEGEKVQACRDMFKGWPGKVHFNYSDKNMGCKARVSSGLDWVFEHTDRAIILEDDCLPHLDFFRFADELLVKYENETRVMSVCGTNTFSDKNFFDSSYCFSKYQNCWGWATWKRSWNLFDRDMSGLDTAIEHGFLRDYLGSRRAAFYWHHVLKKVRDGRINSWAYAWSFTGFLHKGIHVVPKYNLVENIGIGNDATHTKHAPPYLNQKVKPLEFPLSPPAGVSPHLKLDRSIEDTIFSKSIYQRLVWCLRKLTSH